VSPY